MLNVYGAFEKENEYTIRWYFILLNLLNFIAKKFEAGLNVVV